MMTLRALITITLLFLYGCGGGGGDDGDSSPTPPSGNKAPDVSITGDTEFNEGAVVELAALATDSDGSIASYSWEQNRGPEVDIDDISSAELIFDSPDVSEDTVMVFRVTVTDNDGAQASKNVTITILDTPEITITAIDGYLQNATAWLDVNGNLELDDEPSTTTGENGFGRIYVPEIDDPGKYAVLVRAAADTTVDESTGELIELDFILSAAPGVTIVTPFSSLIYLDFLQRSAVDTSHNLNASIQNVAQRLAVEPSLLDEDFIAEDNDELTFFAANLVASTLFPATEDEFIALANADADSSQYASQLETIVTMVSQVVSYSERYQSDLSEVSLLFVPSSDGVSCEAGYQFSDELEVCVIDTDGDGVANDTDTDIDGDGVLNQDDVFPIDASESADTDGDGIGDNADNNPPSVSITPLGSVSAGSQVTLTANATDSDGTIDSYEWQQISGPEVSLSNATSASASFVAPAVSSDVELGFSVRVTDDAAESATATVYVLVEAPNIPPTVEVSVRDEIPESATTSLVANATDVDGTIVSYRWAQISGLAVSLTNTDLATVQVATPKVDVDAEIVISLTVTDNEGAESAVDIPLTIIDYENTLTTQAIEVVVLNTPSPASLEDAIGYEQYHFDHRTVGRLNLDGVSYLAEFSNGRWEIENVVLGSQISGVVEILDFVGDPLWRGSFEERAITGSTITVELERLPLNLSLSPIFDDSYDRCTIYRDELLRDFDIVQRQFPENTNITETGYWIVGNDGSGDFRLYNPCGATRILAHSTNETIHSYSETNERGYKTEFYDSDGVLVKWSQFSYPIESPSDVWEVDNFTLRDDGKNIVFESYGFSDNEYDDYCGETTFSLWNQVTLFDSGQIFKVNGGESHVFYNEECTPFASGSYYSYEFDEDGRIAYCSSGDESNSIGHENCSASEISRGNRGAALGPSELLGYIWDEIKFFSDDGEVPIVLSQYFPEVLGDKTLETSSTGSLEVTGYYPLVFDSVIEEQVTTKLGDFVMSNPDGWAQIKRNGDGTLNHRWRVVDGDLQYQLRYTGARDAQNRDIRDLRYNNQLNKYVVFYDNGMERYARWANISDFREKWSDSNGWSQWLESDSGVTVSYAFESGYYFVDAVYSGDFTAKFKLDGSVSCFNTERTYVPGAIISQVEFDCLDGPG
ncbi:hypothetical protein [uncultured Umboniibacter sp.]|uniref:PKD domain-containing protein n=1 Tax=uncultured Umboniibacter sp. TaxID=1798917 RepID=UPI002628F1CE|nr:hypothetical protein [uncultured Umboniibacter sp.]